MRWGFCSAAAVGALLGLLAASWLETGQVVARSPQCVVWSRGGALVVCTGWAE